MRDILFPGFSDAFRLALNIDEARRINSMDLTPRMGLYLQGAARAGDLLGGIYAWVPTETADDDGRNYIKPDDVTSAEPGRWVVTSVAPIGVTGAKGDTGSAATVAIGTVTTLAAGSSAYMANAGTPNAAVFNLGIPAGVQGVQGIPGSNGVDGQPGAPGKDGAAASIAIGTVTTLAPGAQASITNSGTANAAILNVALPTGPQGIQGQQGVQGPAASISVGSVTTGIPGSAVAVSNSGTSSAAVLDFSIPAGPPGADGKDGVTQDLSGYAPLTGAVFTGQIGAADYVTVTGRDANLQVKSTTSNVAARTVSQSDGNIVMYRTDAQGNDAALWGINSNAGPFAFNIPVTSNGYFRSNGIQSAAFKNIGQVDFSYWSGSTGRNAGWRNDGGSVYLLSSDSQTTQAATETASYNGLRPFQADMTSGAVTMAHDVYVQGNLNANAGMNLAGQANFAGTVWANANNGARASIRCGDDAWLGDANIGHTISITSTSDGNQGKLCFGQSTQTLGMTGNDNYLRWTGDMMVSSWYRSAGSAGHYWEAYGRGITVADNGATYGTITTYGNGLNGWSGYSIGTWATFMASGDTIGIHCPQNGVWVFRSDFGGNATFTGNVTAYSDERLKRDIRPISDVWARYRRLAGIAYERDGKTRVGVGAQTTREAFPETVRVEDDAMQTLSVSYGDLVGPTISVVQMLMDKVEVLERKIDTLEGNA